MATDVEVAQQLAYLPEDSTGPISQQVSEIIASEQGCSGCTSHMYHTQNVVRLTIHRVNDILDEDYYLQGYQIVRGKYHDVIWVYSVGYGSSRLAAVDKGG